MLEAAAVVSNGGFSSHSSHLHSCGDSSEEELSVLTRHTKVVVTGNNRTKSVLVGLQGVFKKAVGLGGWHWLITFAMFCYSKLAYHGRFSLMPNGIEVKLQRNALSVLEPPTGNEEDDYPESEHEHWNCSDIGKPCRCAKVKASHSPFIKQALRRSFSSESQLKDSVSTAKGSSVDLSKLEMAALWRYALHFNLVDTNPNPSKDQLIDVVQRHFVSQQLDELQVIAGFVQAAKRLKKVCK
ncbi:hypothetical protein SASPL_118429 [Salvia splendens]|uniref:Histone deacetylase complex subunit SAP30 Sin3 binding domain-containing protein n=1 Tax=Salvia splendens TaxID=180675 RepID=A0A8X8XXQ8_SALSN|nr:hypothetical protein SASPL_118429 [Salvia splendens]